MQSLPRDPRLFAPAVACPKCNYPNDETFQFCQQCGYRRRTLVDSHLNPQKKLVLDEDGIHHRVQELVQ